MVEYPCFPTSIFTSHFYSLLFAISFSYFSRLNSLFTILVLFNLRKGGYNCTILVSLVEEMGG